MLPQQSQRHSFATTDSKTNGVQSAMNVIPSWKYRKYMIDNADKIRAQSRHLTDSSTPDGLHQLDSTRNQVTWNTHTPYIYTSVHDNTSIPGIPNNEVRGRFLSTMEVRLRHATTSSVVRELP
jgi:hypothetical protein